MNRQVLSEFRDISLWSLKFLIRSIWCWRRVLKAGRILTICFGPSFKEGRGPSSINLIDCREGGGGGNIVVGRFWNAIQGVAIVVESVIYLHCYFG